MVCLNCKIRVVGCHSNCSKYREFKENLDNRNRIIRQAKQPDYLFKEYMNDRGRGQ